ncbi:MAG: ABC transporter ATP-binding protein [Chloroflexota bacterium]|nr:MAG: ABC transporter ATP-binding protein [Chloroflexota bacterium]
MGKPAIEAYRISKQYRIGETVAYYTLSETLSRLASAPFRRRKRLSDDTQLFWALRDVSFTLQHGDVLGVIGKNGSGKSTLLKVLSRITEPTEGRAIVRGRVASLLEVGTGFHFELTGRENIFLNGSILGMKRAEIARKFDEIVAFAEVEKFIDTPVKHYSSGMFLRLAFAVAAHMEPEILIVDEVLAVGDAAFQRKSLGKMSQVADAGRTVIFVSHNMPTVLRLCNVGLLLSSGRVVEQGDIQSVVSAYVRQGMELAGERHFEPAANADLAFTAVRLRDCRDRISAQINLSEGAFVEIDYSVRRPIRAAQIAFRLYNSDGTCVLTSTDFDSEPSRYEAVHPAGKYTARIFLPSNYLRDGSYYLELVAQVPNVRLLDHVQNGISFEVLDDGTAISQGGARPGVIAPVLEWQIAAKA